MVWLRRNDLGICGTKARRRIFFEDVLRNFTSASRNALEGKKRKHWNQKQESANDQTIVHHKKTPTSGRRAKWKLSNGCMERREKEEKKQVGETERSRRKKAGTTHNTQKNEDFLLEK